MSITPTKFFVVSLPRTGTSSLNYMAETLGLKTRHGPLQGIKHILAKNMAGFSDIEFVSDTPCYVYSIILELLKYDNHKFIYSERPSNEWVKSYEGVRLHNTYESIRTGGMPHSRDIPYLMEIFNGGVYSREMATSMFKYHREWVKSTIPNDRILFYNLKTDGWKPFCDFLEKPLPEISEIPHLNKRVIGDLERAEREKKARASANT